MIYSLFRRWRGPLGPWTFVAQLLIGLFFLAAAYHKILIYVVDGRTIVDDVAYWESMSLPPRWYTALLHWMFSLPYGHRVLEIAVMLLQGIGGVFLLLNRRIRLAGWMLVFVQANVFLGTFHHRGFNEFVGVSLIMSLYFALRPRNAQWNARAWNAIVVLTAADTVLYLYNRWNMGDPWISSVAWQRLDLQQDVMSTSWAWKSAVLRLSETSIGPLLWTAPWWMGAALVAFVLWRKTRSYALAGLTILAILRTLTWINSITSQGVLFVLLYFLVLANERESEH